VTGLNDDQICELEQELDKPQEKRFSPTVYNYLAWLFRIHVAKQEGESDTLRVEEIRDYLSKLREDFAPDGTAIMFEVNRFVNCIRTERKEHNRPPATFREWIDRIADKLHRDYELLRIAKPQDQQESDIIVGKMIALADTHSLIKHVIDTEPTSLSCEIKPQDPGRYLLLCRRWNGTLAERPERPSWEVVKWNGIRWDVWESRDTFANDNDPEEYCPRYELVRWQRLPPI
jgi:hypothetical protein